MRLELSASREPWIAAWRRHCALATLVMAMLAVSRGIGAAESASHPPLRTAPAIPKRALPAGPARFVDPARGNDAASGAEDAPWKTIQHGVDQLQPGETLLLRGGVYYENVYFAAEGRADAPITVRGYPGEAAILDGGLRRFFENPASSWELVSKETGEYRSKDRLPSLRTVVGSFGDSMIGLQTYYDPQDLRATGEVVDWEDWQRTDATDIKPLWCGPGLWYDKSTGRLHARLTHTHLPEPVANYRGETDPRKLPLVISAFDSIPLRMAEAKHVRIQDLIIRGGGYQTVRMDQCVDVAFDHVVVWCGTYGMTVHGTNGLKFLNSALFGNVAPWTFRGDGSKRDYPGRPHRNISRLNTHALLEIGTGLESSVYATPQNDNWEIARSEFAEAHDGLYFGSVNVRFHHNLVEHFQDDGLYLSPMYLRHRLDKRDPVIEVDHNVFRGVLTALAFGGTETSTQDRIFIHHNLFDLRMPINTGRPTAKSPEARFSTGKLMGDHGSPPWPAMTITQNTVVAEEASRDVAMNAFGSNGAKNRRRVFNNIFAHLARLPGLVPPDPALDVAGDGNWYWSPEMDVAKADALFARFRGSPQFTASQTLYEPGSETRSKAADPKFVELGTEANAFRDYRLSPQSPARGSGIVLTGDLKSPTESPEANGAPDVGAFPFGQPPFRVGIDGRTISTGKSSE